MDKFNLSTYTFDAGVLTACFAHQRTIGVIDTLCLNSRRLNLASVCTLCLSIVKRADRTIKFYLFSMMLYMPFVEIKYMARLGLSALFVAALLFSHDAALAQSGLSAEMEKVLVQAAAGDAQAQRRLASAYETGKDAPRDLQAAKKWYRAAADQGDAAAQFNVGLGLQAEKQFMNALSWYGKASAQGHALAATHIAYFYELGLGVNKDRKKAFEFFSRAAELGWAEAMLNVGIMYSEGEAVKRNWHLSCIWTNRAARYADKENEMLLSFLGGQLAKLQGALSKDQLAKCKKQAQAWSPKAAVKNKK